MTRRELVAKKNSLPGIYICSQNLCSPVPMFPEPMFPGTYVPRFEVNYSSKPPRLTSFLSLQIVMIIVIFALLVCMYVRGRHSLYTRPHARTPTRTPGRTRERPLKRRRMLTHTRTHSHTQTRSGVTN